ncbi:MAG: tetratricopeptide repeat protein [Fidelibacterota bacterium]
MKLWIIFLSVLTSLTACRKAYEVTGEDLSEYGWDYYAAGNYVEARRWFIESVEERPGYSDGWNGAGWSLGKLDSVSESISYYRTGLYVTHTDDTVYAEILAGMTFAFHALGQWDSCLVRGEEVLYRDSSWVFSRERDITYQTIYVTLASAAFNQGHFDRSLEYIRHLEPAFNPDLSTQEGIGSLADKIETLNLLYR